MPVFWSWWQTIPQSLDPIAFHIFGIPVYWYALFFLAGAFLVYWLAEKELVIPEALTKVHYPDFAFGVLLSALVGGKIGFLLFYWYPFVSEEASGLWLWPASGSLGLPGMSFFGGLVGVVTYLGWFAKKNQKSFFALSDRLSFFIPVAIFSGRLGSFVHGELPGRMTEVMWGMRFPLENFLRHPSTLYAAFLEGVVLFAGLFFLRKQNARKKPKRGFLTGWFCIGYGALRFLSEYFREPDVQIGYLFGTFTLNQIFAVLICGVGAVILSVQNRKN